MNDQAPGLVDTRFIEANNLAVREITGGCFCCRFSDLLESANELRSYEPEVIFAEPVGSCVDLSATIVQPLKAFHLREYRVAPLTVLFDPDVASEVYAGRSQDDMEYLFRHQIAEADILCSTKSDLHPIPTSLPVPVDFSLSSKTGQGVDLWLEEVMHGGRIAGSKLLEVDYSRYEEAEAALGWLNIHARVILKQPANPSMLIGPFMEDLCSRLCAASIQIAHFKVFDQTESGFVKASISANMSTPQVEGDLLADSARSHELAINLRAIADPDDLARIVSLGLDGIPGTVEITHQRSFRPAPPRPEYRFSSRA